MTVHPPNWVARLYKTLASKYRLLIYSGDSDGCVPFVGTEEWTSGLGFAQTEPWRYYYYFPSISFLGPFHTHFASAIPPYARRGACPTGCPCADSKGCLQSDAMPDSMNRAFRPWMAGTPQNSSASITAVGAAPEPPEPPTLQPSPPPFPLPLFLPPSPPSNLNPNPNLNPNLNLNLNQPQLLEPPAPNPTLDPSATQPQPPNPTAYFLPLCTIARMGYIWGHNCAI